MDRQSNIPTIHSIALLQERFRQLQRVKEMRQKRELLQLLSESEQVHASSSYETSGFFFHFQQIPAAGPPLQCSLYHQPNMQSKHSDLQVNEMPLLVNLDSADTIMQKTNIYHDSDVDTSLHL